MEIHVKDISAKVDGYVREVLSNTEGFESEGEMTSHILAHAVAHLEAVSIILAPMEEELIRSVLDMFLQSVVEEKKRFVQHTAKDAAARAIEKAGQQ